jgi:hypothetical protein
VRGVKDVARIVSLWFVVVCGSFVMLAVIRLSRGDDGSWITLMVNALAVAINANNLLRTFKTPEAGRGDSVDSTASSLQH